MSSNNQQLVLKRRPTGMPTAEDFSYEDMPIPTIQENEVLVHTLYLSVDPYMRGRMNDTRSYVAPFQLNEPLAGGVLGEIIASNHADFKKGDLVTGNLPFRQYNAVHGSLLRPIDPSIGAPTAFLGPLGMTGMTAYVGLFHIGQPDEDDTVVVSGAAGAVGSIVCQLAKLAGARVIGIAGSDEKCHFLTKDLKVDAAINYKSENFSEELENICPDGVDVYFDNVGGPVSDAVLQLLNDGARIPLCGQISLYNLQELDHGPRIQPLLLTRRAMMKGFIVSDYAHLFDEGSAYIAKQLANGSLTYREHIVDGFDQTIDAFLGLFTGKNTGKLLVRAGEPEAYEGGTLEAAK
ncbi:NADP-dependent oxidoreductase [Bacillaceae bacterium SIJ1]|uniref:NADP-dependent oxidoreductase n=1 Tax=Litoribacterium kuwaitense TaxID=1398745 RepID=UPI0013EA2BB0|nr:NADP-dependent oxidoreductase [Litoribacterium kuwaitense]NGP45879.1 NADP-dependent oxidoreductase [Litoribacterium kuwaitense]